MKRKNEVRKLLQLSEEDVIERAGNHLHIVETLEDLHKKFAQDIYNTILNNNLAKKNTRLILPIGPVGQYPLLADIINRNAEFTFKNCWFFFMDEYCSDEGKALSPMHPLSFKGILKQNFLNLLTPNCKIDKERIIFPNENNIEELEQLIHDKGEIETCYGGIGLRGHLAFNEPMIGVRDTGPRKVTLNHYTITLNAIRANIGGDTINFPQEAFTLGMRQILSADKIRLYCRSDILDWAKVILRIALFGKPGDDFPVTHIRPHPDYKIITDKATLSGPRFII